MLETIGIIVILLIMFVGIPMHLFALLSEPGEFSSPKDFLIKFFRCYLPSLFDFGEKKNNKNK